MDVSGELQAAAALSHEKYPCVSNEQKATLNLYGTTVLVLYSYI
jgi:hypothetical protein